MPIKLKAIITSPTILKVGVNIGNDMRRFYQEFGHDYAGRCILDLSKLARITDVGLVGTRVGDLDSNRARVGIGVKKG
ncbi:3'-5' exonuclease [Ceratobasidium sp. AG-Ba]|nr:3'-5' exonuclease [Ceratobasidium sp. AG-Ba]